MPLVREEQQQQALPEQPLLEPEAREEQQQQLFPQLLVPPQHILHVQEDELEREPHRQQEEEIPQDQYVLQELDPPQEQEPERPLPVQLPELEQHQPLRMVAILV